MGIFKKTKTKEIPIKPRISDSEREAERLRQLEASLDFLREKPSPAPNKVVAAAVKNDAANDLNNLNAEKNQSFKTDNTNTIISNDNNSNLGPENTNDLNGNSNVDKQQEMSSVDVNSADINNDERRKKELEEAEAARKRAIRSKYGRRMDYKTAKVIYAGSNNNLSKNSSESISNSNASNAPSTLKANNEDAASAVSTQVIEAKKESYVNVEDDNKAINVNSAAVKAITKETEIKENNSANDMIVGNNSAEDNIAAETKADNITLTKDNTDNSTIDKDTLVNRTIEKDNEVSNSISKGYAVDNPIENNNAVHNPAKKDNTVNIKFEEDNTNDKTIEDNNSDTNKTIDSKTDDDKSMKEITSDAKDADSVKAIKNPLPTPTKTVHREMEFDIMPSPDDMHFDLVDLTGIDFFDIN